MFLGNIAKMTVIYKKAWLFILISQVFVLASCMMMILIPSEVQNLINNGVLLGDAGRDVIIQSVSPHHAFRLPLCNFHDVEHHDGRGFRRGHW